ncbi:MAG: YoaK family protein [Solirubrobacteraceae bacterium]
MPDTPPATGLTDPPSPALTVRSLRHPLTRALILLTLTTGLVDAASYLGLGRVFAANMTGNVVLLGFGIAGAGGLPVVAPLVSLGAFLLGAGAGGRLAGALGNRRRLHVVAALGIETALVGVAGVIAVVADVRPATFLGDLVIALLALGMGTRNATVRTLSVPDLTTTVLTMTLTGLAADSRLFGGSGAGTARRTTAVASMLIGAVLGALLLKASLALVLFAAAALAAATLVGYGRRAGPG